MRVGDYVKKMCELGLENNMLRVIQKGEYVYEGSMSGVVNGEKEYPWVNDTVLGLSALATDYRTENGTKYSTMISI